LRYFPQRRQPIPSSGQKVRTAMTDMIEIDPAATDQRALYRMLIGAVVPRPIGWASTMGANGVANLAPFSFFTVVCTAPPMISLTIMPRADGSEKHTLKNARASGEFCFNVVTEPVWRQMVDSANGFPEDESEFAETGLTPIPGVRVRAPRVKEVPIHFECRLHQVLELGARPSSLLIGEVVYLHVDRACMTDGYVDMRKLKPVGRLNGFFYTTLGDILEREFRDGAAR
jgi:flavin reductase (DIM6/NTAB) family NADH-FMN oxidoreductase RutF